MASAKADSGRNLASELAYLTQVFKAPSLAASIDGLAERARAECWSHEEFLAACLQREVAARESHSGEARIRAARFPARKAIEDFDFGHQRSLSVRSSPTWAPWTSSLPAKTWCSWARQAPARPTCRSAWNPRGPGRAPRRVRHRSRMGRPARRRLCHRESAAGTGQARTRPGGAGRR